MRDPKQKLSPKQVADADLVGWHHDDDVLRSRFATGDFATGLRLVALVGESAEAANHHPDILLTYPHVTIKLTSHDVGGITSRDVDLARAISGHAQRLGLKTVGGSEHWPAVGQAQ